MIDDDDDRPLADWEYPDGEDEDDVDSTPTRPCPLCGCDVYDDAEQCPLCGEYLTREMHREGAPAWIKAAAVAALVGILTVLGFCL